MVRILDGSYIDRDACDAAFARMHQRDPLGDRIHLIFACVGLVCLFGPVTLSEIAFAPLTVFFFVRVLNTFPLWIHAFGQPIVLVVLALSLWMMLSLGWSLDSTHGWGEIAELRWFVLVGVLYPVIEKRTILIASMCVGIGIGQLAQVVDAFDGFGIGWLSSLVENNPGRIAGWWHPVVGGTILVSALGLYLPLALFGIGRSRLVGVLAGAVVGVGLISTNTRGAWIAALLLCVFVLFFGVFTKQIRWRRAVVCSGISVLVVLSAGVILRDSIRTRLDETRAEISEILDGELGSYSGVRVQMARSAVRAGVTHPIRGVGAGGYQRWSIEQDPDSGVHAHAHNSFLHIWSTLGLVGVLLWSTVIVVLLRSAWRIWDREREGVFGLVPMFAIVGLVLASITDTVQLNTQTAAMLGALSALSPSYRPRNPRVLHDQPTVQGSDK